MAKGPCSVVARKAAITNGDPRKFQHVLVNAAVGVCTASAGERR